MSKITVHMTKETLYDFLLYHAYSKFNGFMANILGFAIIFMGVFSYVTGRTGTAGLICFLAAAAAFIAYTPLLLYRRAGQQVKGNPEYKNPVEYTFSDEEGISAVWDGGSRQVDWKQVQRAVVAPKTIGVYYGKDEALILPKKDFGDEFLPIYQMIVRHLAENSNREDTNAADGHTDSEDTGKNEADHQTD